MILANVRAEEKQMILSLARQQLFKPENIFFITDFTNTKEAEIEDMFADEFYLDLVRSSGIAVSEQAEIENGRIIEQVQQFTNTHFDSLKPAMHFMKDQHTLLQKVDGLTLSRFEDMFIKINQTAPLENGMVAL